MSFVFSDPNCVDAHLDTKYLSCSSGCVAAKKVGPLVNVEVFGDNATSDVGRLVITLVVFGPSHLD